MGQNNYLQKAWDDEMDLIGFRPSVADKEEVYHLDKRISNEQQIRSKVYFF
jgi:hypothetical protein